jgi:hypothetical protein
MKAPVSGWLLQNCTKTRVYLCRQAGLNHIVIYLLLSSSLCIQTFWLVMMTTSLFSGGIKRKLPDSIYTSNSAGSFSVFAYRPVPDAVSGSEYADDERI